MCFVQGGRVAWSFLFFPGFLCYRTLQRNGNPVIHHQEIISEPVDTLFFESTITSTFGAMQPILGVSGDFSFWEWPQQVLCLTPHPTPRHTLAPMVQQPACPTAVTLSYVLWTPGPAFCPLLDKGGGAIGRNTTTDGQPQTHFMGLYRLMIC